VSDGVVYVADTSGTVYALDLAGGAERWRQSLTSHGPLDATIADGSLFVSGGPDGILDALDPADGAVRWQAPVGTTTVPAFDAASVYEAGGGFRALDATTGATRWLDATGDDVLGAASVANGIAYLGASHDPPYGHLRAVDARTGVELWQADRLSSPTVVDGVAYAGSGDGEVSARDAGTGRERWKITLPGVTREPAFAEGMLYILSEGDGSVHALDAATGSEIWRVALGDQLGCCIAVAKGRILLGSRSGTIYTLGDDRGVEASSLPGASPRPTNPVPSAATKPTNPPTAPLPAPMIGTLLWSTSGPGEQFNWPEAVAVDPGSRSWVADPWNDRFAIFEADGSFAGYWATPKAGDGHFRLNRPNTDGYGGIAFAPDGGFYVLDVGDRRVVEFDADRAFVRAWGAFGSSPGTFLDPVAITVGSDGSVYVFDDQRGVVERFGREGDLKSTIDVFGGTTGPGFNKGDGLAVDQDGNVYVGLDESRAVVEFDPTGRQVQIIGGPASDHPLRCNGSMAVDAHGRIYIACYGVSIYDGNGTYVAGIGSEHGDARLTYAAGIALDPQGALYVVDAGNVGGGDLSNGHLKKYAIPTPPQTP
jgi:outer membrane protein assembly factor BamB